MASKKPMMAKVILTQPFANKEVGEVLDLDPVLAASIVSRGVAVYYKAVSTETAKETIVIKQKKVKKNEKDT